VLFQNATSFHPKKIKIPITHFKQTRIPLNYSLLQSLDNLPAASLAPPSTATLTPFLLQSLENEPEKYSGLAHKVRTYTYFPACEHRNVATPAISSGSPSRPRGLSLLKLSSPPRLLIKPCASLLGKKPGAIILDVMFLEPSSTAKFLPRCFTQG
jgi:hypothetical protein